VALLKTASPFIRSPRENYYQTLPIRTAQAKSITFDSIWYVHNYLDAAWEIAEGWFEDPLHHYLEVGRLRGYLPTRPLQQTTVSDLSLPNLALGKRARQSSISAWSRGGHLEEDAGNAVDGILCKDYAFHTDNGSNPWWSVDLGEPAYIHWLRIFNRDHLSEAIQGRASPLLVETSNDENEWRTLFSTEAGHLFGGYGGGSPPIWTCTPPTIARFVRVSIPRPEYLHLAQVEIYGRFIADQG
jgi:hypothetical protein